MKVPPDDPARPEIERKVDRKMLDDIFGDVLPVTTADERDPGSPSDTYDEQWYRDNRPPHHDG